MIEVGIGVEVEVDNVESGIRDWSLGMQITLAAFLNVISRNTTNPGPLSNRYAIPSNNPNFHSL